MSTTSRRGGVAITAVVMLVLAGCGGGDAEAAPSVQTAAVARGDLRIIAEATGTVEPIRKVEVKSKASGEVLSLGVDVGDRVQTGALLARIDPRDVRNSFDQAKADLEVAQARFEISQAQAARSKELVEGGVITAQEYENARLDLANAQASLIKAQTNFELAELRQGDVTITAPLEGTIIQKSVEEGQVIQSASQNVSGGTTLFVMANLQEMQVRTLVDETDMGQIRSGMPANVRVEAFPDRTFEGYVDLIEPQAVVQQNVTMFPVIVRLDNREGQLRPGMNAEVEVLIDQASDILLVPNNAIVLPQDVGPAALVLGVDPETLDMAALGGRRAGGRAGARAGAPAGNAGPEAAAPASDAQAGAGRRPELDSLRARMQRGEIPPDSARGLARGAGARQGQAPAGGMLAAPGAGAGMSGAPAAGGEGAPRRALRRAVVFVINAQGVPEPRSVQIGLNDWDYTQIVSGVEEGDEIAILGAAQLQAQQQEFLNRFRGGGLPFGGGFGGRGR